MTVCGVVTGTPPLETVTLTLVVPKAESGPVPMPNTGDVMVTVAAPMEYPIELLTATPPTWAVAVMVAAPAAEILAGSRVMLATPEPFVNAVPLVGVIFAKVASVVNVTTALGTGAPAPSNKVAETVVGPAVLIEVTGDPEASVSLSDSAAAA